MDSKTKVNLIETDLVSVKDDGTFPIDPLSHLKVSKQSNSTDVNVRVLNSDPFRPEAKYGYIDYISLKDRIVRSAEETKRLKYITTAIAQNDAGKNLLNNLYEDGYVIGFSNHCGKDIAGTHFPGLKVIILNKNYKDDTLINTIIHEGRHANQEINGNYALPFNTIAKMTFEEADAVAYEALIWNEIVRQKGSNIDKTVFDTSSYRKSTRIAMEKAIYTDGKSNDDAMSIGVETFLTTNSKESPRNRILNDCYYEPYLTNASAFASNEPIFFNEDDVLNKVLKSVDGKGSYFTQNREFLFSDKYIRLNDKNAQKLKALQKNIYHIKDKDYRTNENYVSYIKNNRKLKSLNNKAKLAIALKNISKLDRCG